MKLVHLEVKNYRSLFADDEGRNFELRPGDGVNAIVGPNNAGKSNIFRALAIALDPDFEFNRQRDMPVASVWAKPTITLTFEIRETGRTSSQRTLLKYLHEYERAAHPNGRSTYADEGTVRLRVTIESGPDDSGVRRATFLARGAGGRVLAHDDELTLRAVRQLQKCFHFVLIRSGQSLDSLLHGKFRDILRTVLQEHLRKEYEGAEKSRQVYVSDLQKKLLDPLRIRIEGELADLFPEISGVSLIPDVRALDETLTQMAVQVQDTATTDLSDKGTGVRGGLIVAMLQHFVDTGRQSLLFAVEEPEAFLHPAAQEALRGDLEELAGRRDVSLLVTSHSPYIVSRRPGARVFAIDKDEDGRTHLVSSSDGDEPQAAVLGGLFRDRIAADILDRSSSIDTDAAAVVVVEGTTDIDFARIACLAAARPELYDGLTYVNAGSGVLGANAGGARLGVMQAIVTRSMTSAPVVALFDNDNEGQVAAEMLRSIGKKTGDWKKGKTVRSYSEAFDASYASTPFEAEDLWSPRVLDAFVEEHGDATYSRKEEFPGKLEGWRYSIKPAYKGAFVGFLETNATAEDSALWIEFIEDIYGKLGAQVPEPGGARTSLTPRDELIEEQVDGRAKSAWPLPGGREQWKETLDEMLSLLVPGGKSLGEAEQWLQSRFERVNSERTARGYWRFLSSLGVADVARGHAALTRIGHSYISDPTAEHLGTVLTDNVWGVKEMLGLLTEGRLPQRTSSSTSTTSVRDGKRMHRWPTDCNGCVTPT